MPNIFTCLLNNDPEINQAAIDLCSIAIRNAIAHVDTKIFDSDKHNYTADDIERELKPLLSQQFNELNLNLANDSIFEPLKTKLKLWNPTDEQLIARTVPGDIIAEFTKDLYIQTEQDEIVTDTSGVISRTKIEMQNNPDLYWEDNSTSHKRVMTGNVWSAIWALINEKRIEQQQQQQVNKLSTECSKYQNELDNKIKNILQSRYWIKKTGVKDCTTKEIIETTNIELINKINKFPALKSAIDQYKLIDKISSPLIEGNQSNSDKLHQFNLEFDTHKKDIAQSKDHRAIYFIKVICAILAAVVTTGMGAIFFPQITMSKSARFVSNINRLK